jgi:hypothetical protein
MQNKIREYDLYFKFIETYAPVGFKGIDPDSPLMIELEEMMEKNDQFFYIADIIQMKVLFTSKRSTLMVGIEPDEMTPYIFMEATHPDDIHRLSLGRTKVVKLAQDLFIAGKGTAFLSTNFKVRNPAGEYSNLFIQTYLVYTSIPYKTVFFLKIHTNIDWCKKIKNGYHYYLGNDPSTFRYPDEELLNIGNIFSGREFEIIKLIETGLSTEQIAEKLFISELTVNTHRSNILKKSGKATLPELIYDLIKQGVL